MTLKILLLAAGTLPAVAGASTVQFECSQTTRSGLAQMIFAKIDDSSDMAEVRLFATSAEFAKNNSCKKLIYKKDALLRSIRLTNVIQSESLIYTTTIEIDRSSLAVVTRNAIASDGVNTEFTARGQCTVNVIPAKNTL